MKRKYIHVLVLLIYCMLTSCNKFLEEKSDKRLTTPATIADLNALLQHNNMFLSFSSAGQVSCDDLYITDTDYNGLYYDSDKRLYAWQPDHVSKGSGTVGNNWQSCYSPIFVCNSVIQSLDENNLTGPEADQVRGQAMVLRAVRYLDGAQVWAPVYNPSTANTDLGMVIRLDPDMNIPSKRSTVQQTYDQIIKDLTEAIPLLPETSIFPAIPTKAAAMGLLARTYLFMGNYEQARKNAEEALSYNANLIDFNTLKSKDAFPLPGTKIYAPEEILFFGVMTINDIDINSAIRISPDLYSLYSSGDLRKDMYFKEGKEGSYLFKGSHSRSNLFTGITTAEQLLVIAECYARNGELENAANTLDKVRVKRWKPELFVPSSFKDKNEALTIIIEERRRELAFRGLRWADLKRLNRDGANITLTRTINGETRTLPPNDKRYAIAIPEDIIEIAKIQQNPR